MIDFACICGERLSVPEDQAGGMLQCPACNRLVDVPNLSDLKQIAQDGTYVVDETPIAEDPNRIHVLTRAFTTHRVDDAGNEIDLRNDPVELLPAEIEPLELLEEAPSPARVVPPRYDPITGELIRAMEVTPKAEDAEAEIPMAKAVLAYAAPHIGGSGTPSGFQICVEVLKPINVIVVLIVFIMHMALTMTAFITIIAILPVVLLLFELMFCIGHWSIVVESMGPDRLDELPRPLRNFYFGEDIWWPFCHMFFSLSICYIPGIYVAARWGQAWSSFAWLLVGAGTALFPAVLLTMCTSRSIVNLRPDRLAGVIWACGMDYAFAVVGCAVALAAYVSTLGMVLDVFSSVARATGVFHLTGLLGTYPMLFVALFVMHAFCWYLGVLYLRHHEQFPWAFQRHERTRSPAPRRRPNYLASPPVAAQVRNPSSRV
jgi:hypothetical protein